MLVADTLLERLRAYLIAHLRPFEVTLVYHASLDDTARLSGGMMTETTGRKPLGLSPSGQPEVSRGVHQHPA
jgi:hypothetical protein